MGALRKLGPHQLYRVIMTPATVIFFSGEFTKPPVRPFGKRSQAVFRPEERVVVLPGFAINLGDLLVAVRARQVPAHDRHQLFDIARRLRQRFHDVRDAEVMAPFGPLVLRGSRRHLIPFETQTLWQTLDVGKKRCACSARRGRA